MDYSQLLLIAVFAALIIFMFYSSRKRLKKQKEEQEKKATQTVPGAEVLLQGGLYGTIVSYDPVNLDEPAIVEIAPDVHIKVHSQAILRIVDPAEGTVTEDEFIEAEVSGAEYAGGVADGDITSISDDRRIAEIEAAEERAEAEQAQADANKKPDA